MDNAPPQPSTLKSRCESVLTWVLGVPENGRDHKELGAISNQFFMILVRVLGKTGGFSSFPNGPKMAILKGVLGVPEDPKPC